MNSFATLIVLAEAAGLPIDGDPVSPFEISIDDVPLTVSVDRRSGADSVVLCSQLGEVPQTRELEVYRVLLEANVLWSATGDATLAVNSATREALLCYKYPMEGLETGAFASLVVAFVELARGWRNFVSAATEEVQAPSDPASAGMVRA